MIRQDGKEIQGGESEQQCCAAVERLPPQELPARGPLCSILKLPSTPTFLMTPVTLL